MDVDQVIDKSDCFVIRATNVPLEFLQNRDVAKKYFRRFGKVKLVMFKPKRAAVVIEYANEDSMLNALELAGEYNGHVFNVTRDTETIIKKKKIKKDPDPDWTEDTEVRAELEAMGAFGAPRVYDLRSEAMIVDPPDQLAKSKRKWKSMSPKPLKKKSVSSRDSPLGSDQSELANIIRQQAFTVEDKFRILDARDKLIRNKLKRSIELFKTSATVGTCPDMCPEKERLMRETQHQVALYEQEGKGMNPRLAVKQYSRSSADQEAPLPQELRPVSVLQMTMGYLMHRIMGLCDTADVNLAEWYHFLWDRTRGIRKDITQQELCCQGSVELVEQCARFHIFCSARLVSEDPSVFDQKINTENLTKCLQTLKYMYHDLQLKGESCRNEPEFRAYIILLNLNDGNFMWEVQQLKNDIQQSKEVKFALEVYSSLDKHNHVKFFKLVNSTTHLNACILMRYFIQVRVWAIKTLLKSYSPRNSECTIEFFESYGLYTNVERSRIILDKPSFSDPEYAYVLDRAINLVESKRTFSIGEVVCGKELPPKIFENHVPQNSFDDDGYLELSPDLDEVDARKEEPVVKVKEQKEKLEDPPRIFISPAVPVPVTSTPVNFFAPKQSDHSRNIFGQAPDKKIVAPIDNDTKISTTKSLWSTPPTTKTNIFGTVEGPKNIFGGKMTQLAPLKHAEPAPSAPEVKVEAPQVVIDQKRIDEEFRRRKQEEEGIHKKIREKQRKAELEKKLLQEKLRRLEEAKRAAALKMKLIEEEERQIAEREKQKELEIKKAVSDVIGDLLDEVEDKIKNDKLKEISKRMHDRKLKRIVAKWKENTRRKRKRKAIDFNPLWFATRTLQEEADELRTSSQNLTLASIKRYKRGKPFEIQTSEASTITKLNLDELIYKPLTTRLLRLEMKLRQEYFWKITISVPSESEFSCGLNHIERVLDDCIQWKKKNSTSVLIEQSKGSPRITYCLEKQKGSFNATRNDTHGFVFIANDFNDDLRSRIINNFKSYGVFVKVPIVLALQTYNEDKSNLEALIKEGIISDYLVIVDKFTSRNLSNILEEAAIFLATRIEKAPPLEMDTLKSFLAKYLCSDLWKRANSFAKWNCNYKNCLKNPTTVVYLYNEALDRLKSVLLDESCKEYAKFPEIFKPFLRSEIPDSLPCDYKYFPNFWDHPSYIKHLGEVLTGLKLPNFLENWPPKDEAQLEVGVSKYCARIFKEPQTTFYKIMSVLLKNVDPGANFDDICHVMWTDVVELLGAEKLNQTDFSLYGTGFVNKSIYNQLIVVYDVDALGGYVRSDWFYIDNPVIKHKILQSLQDDEDEVGGLEQDMFEDFDIDEALAKIREPRGHDINQIKREMTDCKRLLGDLEDSFVIHKKILEKSGHLLKTIVEHN